MRRLLPRRHRSGVRVVADSHVLIFYLFTPDRLSEPALETLGKAEDGAGIVVSTATLGDLVRLAQKWTEFTGPRRLRVAAPDRARSRHQLRGRAHHGRHDGPFRPRASHRVGRPVRSVHPRHRGTATHPTRHRRSGTVKGGCRSGDSIAPQCRMIRPIHRRTNRAYRCGERQCRMVLHAGRRSRSSALGSSMPRFAHWSITSVARSAA